MSPVKKKSSETIFEALGVPDPDQEEAEYQIQKESTTTMSVSIDKGMLRQLDYLTNVVGKGRLSRSLTVSNLLEFAFKNTMTSEMYFEAYNYSGNEMDQKTSKISKKKK